MFFLLMTLKSISPFFIIDIKSKRFLKRPSGNLLIRGIKTERNAINFRIESVKNEEKIVNIVEKYGTRSITRAKDGSAMLDLVTNNPNQKLSIVYVNRKKQIFNPQTSTYLMYVKNGNFFTFRPFSTAHTGFKIVENDGSKFKSPLIPKKEKPKHESESSESSESSENSESPDKKKAENVDKKPEEMSEKEKNELARDEKELDLIRTVILKQLKADFWSKKNEMPEKDLLLKERNKSIFENANEFLEKMTARKCDEEKEKKDDAFEILKDVFCKSKKAQ